MARFKAHSYAMPTTAPGVRQALVAATIKTLLQVQAPATRGIEIIAWGFGFGGTAANQPVDTDLVVTGTVAATVTAHVAAGVQPWDARTAGGASDVQLGTAATGFAATAEGTITATRTLDDVPYPPTQPYAMWFPKDDRPWVLAGQIVRVRMLAAIAMAVGIGAEAWMLWEE